MAYVYVASPYTSPDPTIMEERFLLVERYCANAVNAKHSVYSPIVHFHAMSQRYTMPTDHEFWAYMNFAMIAPCERLEVLQLPGWDVSKGIASETRFAKAWDIPIIHIDADHEWLRAPTSD